MLNGTTATQVDYSKELLPVTRIETISNGVIDWNKLGYVENFEGIKKYKLEKGDLLLSHINSMAMIGNCALYEEDDDLYLGMNLLRLRPNRNTCPNFIFYCLNSAYVIADLKSYAKPAINQASISTTNLKRVKIPTPDYKSQKEISDFLDHEIERIAHLIRKKENFVLLVQEKKLALANQILNGSILNLDQSGDKGWFGSLPVSWPTQRGKFLFKEAHGRSETGDEELLTVSHITGVTKRSEKDVNMFMAETMEGYKLVLKGDIIVNTMWAWMGAMGVSPHDGLISPSYGVYRPLRKYFEDAYLDLILRSKAFIAESTRRSKGIHSLSSTSS